MRESLSHLPLLLKMSGEASILILLILAAQQLCGPRLRPCWRHALWLLVVLRLALPWSIPSPASLFNVLRIPTATPSAQAIRNPEAPASVSIETVRPAAAVAPATHGHWHWELAWFWAAGAVSLALYALTGQYRFTRRVRRLRPLTDGPTLALLEDCKTLMGVSTPVSLIETAAVKGPTLFGFLRPRLLLPTGLLSTFTPEELRHVFLHELAHIKRQDILTGWLTLVVQIVHWFNPLVWLAFYRLRADRELACDALALFHARPGENEAYGLTIVKLLEGFGQSVWGPNLAGILENKQQMKARIIMIAKYHKTDRGMVLAVLLLAGLALATLTDAQNQTSSQPPQVAGPDAAQGVWVVKFEPVGDFSPKTPGEFLARIHVYSGQSGELGYFRTVKQGNKLVGSFLASDPDQLKAALDQIAGLKVTAVQKLTKEQLDQYEKSPQEALVDVKHLDAAKGVWAVRFEMTGDFSPKTPGDFLGKIQPYAHCQTGQSGAIGYFRTTKQGTKLVGSFLAYDPDQLKVSLAKVPDLKITSVDKLTQPQLDRYEKSPQESLVDIEHLEASMGIWAVRFEPVGDFSPKTPGELLDKIQQFAKCNSGQGGVIGYFRTTKQGDKLVGSFLAYDPDLLKAELAKVPDLKITAADKLTEEQLADYKKLPQESL
jgi:beta-lactamase regulating signal transducer with metallopeptidase domain